MMGDELYKCFVDGVVGAVAGARVARVMLQFCCDVLGHEHAPLAWWCIRGVMAGDDMNYRC